MSNEFTVNLSPRQLLDVYLFLRGTVKPKDMDEVENFASVFKTFRLNKFKDRVTALKEGESLKFGDYSTEAEAIPSGSVDLKALIGYVKALGGAVDLEMALRLRDVYDELVRARDHKPKLESVPEGA